MRDEVVRSLLEIVELGITSGHEAEETGEANRVQLACRRQARHASPGRSRCERGDKAE